MDTYEKKYKEALERAEGVIEQNPLMEYLKKGIEYIFPELKESEDERIRNAAIDACKYMVDNFENSTKQYEDAIVWLEKQGKQMSDPRYSILEELLEADTIYQMAMNDAMVEEAKMKALEAISNMEIFGLLGIEKQGEREKPQVYETRDGEIITYSETDGYKVIEPKFKVGDWIVYNRNDSSREILYVYDIRDGRYYFNDNIHFSWSAKECDEKSHLWTIQDAKDGDVLAFKDGTSGVLIYKDYLNEVSGVFSHCRIIRNSFIDKEESGWGPALLSPATKEQRDILFEEMQKKGYEWDAEKKELKKISQRMISAEAKEAMYSNPAWSEEDNKWIESLIQTFEDGYLEGFNQLESYGVISWLKSLKQKIGG